MKKKKIKKIKTGQKTNQKWGRREAGLTFLFNFYPHYCCA
jgi:hypothetical protein